MLTTIFMFQPIVSPTQAACDIMGNEIIRLMQLTSDSIEPVRFEVPRKEKGRVLNEDLFPSTAAPMPSYTAAEWLHGDADALEGPQKLPVLEVREMLGFNTTAKDDCEVGVDIVNIHVVMLTTSWELLHNVKLHHGMCDCCCQYSDNVVPTC
jgi:hypothetical protein